MMSAGLESEKTIRPTARQRTVTATECSTVKRFADLEA